LFDDSDESDESIDFSDLFGDSISLDEDYYILDEATITLPDVLPSQDEILKTFSGAVTGTAEGRYNFYI
jgi:hypothetical protein